MYKNETEKYLSMYYLKKKKLLSKELLPMVFNDIQDVQRLYKTLKYYIKYCNVQLQNGA